MIQQCKKDRDFLTIEGEAISIEAAARPTDVLWHNMKVSDQEGNIYSVYSWLVFWFVMGVSYVIYLYLMFWQNSIAANAHGLSFVPYIVTVLFSAF
jgi:hypothetical protein